MDNNNNMVNAADLDAWMKENPNFMEWGNYDSSLLMTDTDAESINPAVMAYGNEQLDMGNCAPPQEIVPLSPDPTTLPQQQQVQVQHPQWHYQIGWYYPAAKPTGVPRPPPPRMIPVAGMMPPTSVPSTGTSTPVPAVPNTTPAPAPAPAPTRTQGKRNYGTSAYLDARAEGRTSISIEEANYFASSASRRDGRGNVVNSEAFDQIFRFAKSRPSIVQACICNHEAERIKRPKNMFVLYRLAKAHQIRKRLGTNSNQNISREAAAMWHAESAEVKEHFTKLAAAEAKHHAQKYPNYKYKAGGQQKAKFGTKDCRCGAYALNMARFLEKRGAKSGKQPVARDVDDESDANADADPDDDYVQSRRTCQQAPGPTAVMVPPPDPAIASFGLRGYQGAEAEKLYAGMKRKLELTITTGRNESAEQPRKRRSPRNTVGTVNYTEPNDGEPDFGKIEDLFDFGASCKTPSSTNVERFSPKDTRSSRQNSLRSRQQSNGTSKSSLLFVSLPAKNTRSHSRSSPPMTPIQEAETPVVPKKPTKRTNFDAPTEVEADEIVVRASTTRSSNSSTRSQASACKSSRRSGGK